MVKARLFFISLLFIHNYANGQFSSFGDSAFFQYVQGKDELVDRVLRNREKYRLQFCVSEVIEDSVHFIVDLNTQQYFYPASTVKLPVALLTLEKLKSLGLSLDYSLRFNKDVKCGNTSFVDDSKRNRLTFRKMIEEMLVVSDNNYYNALYHFLTPHDLNHRLKELGYLHTNIYKSFTGCNADQQLKCNSLQVLNEEGEVVFEQPFNELSEEFRDVNYKNDSNKLLGVMHENEEGYIVKGPYDFNINLEVDLHDLNSMMIHIFYPWVSDYSDSWNLNEEEKLFVVNCLKKFPRELTSGQYKDKSSFPDNVYKYIVHGEKNLRPSGFETYSKIGLSYGFTTEVAYVQNNDSGVNYFMTISMYTNKNDVVNDGNYEYESLARPFISKLSLLAHDYIQQLPKK